MKIKKILVLALIFLVSFISQCFAQATPRLPEAFGPLVVDGNPNCPDWGKGIFISGRTCYKSSADAKCSPVDSANKYGGRVIFFDFKSKEITTIYDSRDGLASIARGVEFDKSSCILYFSHGSTGSSALARVKLKEASIPFSNRAAYGTYASPAAPPSDIVIGAFYKIPILLDSEANRMYLSTRLDGHSVDMIQVPAPTASGASTRKGLLHNNSYSVTSLAMYLPSANDPDGTLRPQIYTLSFPLVGNPSSPNELRGYMKMTKAKTRYNTYDGYATRTIMANPALSTYRAYDIDIDPTSKKLYMSSIGSNAFNGTQSCSTASTCPDKNVAKIFTMNIAPDDMNVNATDANQNRPDHCNRMDGFCAKSMFRQPYLDQIYNNMLASKSNVYTGNVGSVNNYWHPLSIEVDHSSTPKKLYYVRLNDIGIGSFGDNQLQLVGATINEASDGSITLSDEEILLDEHQLSEPTDLVLSY